MGNRSAFTLIEMLLAVSIVCLLLAIALPVLNSARAMSRQTQCMNNLRQIGLGTIAYRDAYKGLVPFALGGVGGDGRIEALNALSTFGGWGPTAIDAPDRLLVCPDDQGRAALAGSSYKYMLSPLLFMALADGPESASLVVGRFVEQRPNEFVFRDDFRFHGKGTIFLGVRLNGKAGNFEDLN